MSSMQYKYLFIISVSQCGSDSDARKLKEDMKWLKKSEKPYHKDWSKQKIPYDFTGCLTHLDITYTTDSFKILCITGILGHNEACEKQDMQCLPPVPLHRDVWQHAIELLAAGASYAFSFMVWNTI